MTGIVILMLSDVLYGLSSARALQASIGHILPHPLWLLRFAGS